MYTTKADGTVDVKGRVLRTIKVIFDPGRLEYEDHREMIQLGYSLIKHYPEVHGILIFGYSSLKQFNHGSYDRGRVVLTRDGRGWTGNGFVLDGNTKDELGILWFQKNVNSQPVRVIVPPDSEQEERDSLWKSIQLHLGRKEPKHVKPPIDPSLIGETPPSGQLFVGHSPKICLYCHRSIEDHAVECPTLASPIPGRPLVCPTCFYDFGTHSPYCPRRQG